MIRTRITVLLIAVVISAAVEAQSPEIDSLNQLIESADENVSKVNHILALCDHLRMIDPVEVVYCGTQAVNLSDKLDYNTGKALGYKQIGIGYYYQGDYINSINYWQQSLALFEEMEDKAGIANMLTNIGAIHSSEGDEAYALDLYLRALNIAEEINDTLRMATALINIGLIYLRNPADHDKAMEIYLKAIPISRKLGDLDAIGTASVNVGEIYLAKGDYPTALEYFQEALAAFRQSRTGSVSYALTSIGKIYSKLKEFQRAMDYHKEALAIAESTESMAGIADVHLNIADTYMDMGDANQAIRHFTTVKNISEEIGAVYLLRDACRGLAHLYSEKADFKKAFEFQDIVTSLGDTINAQDSRNMLTKLQFHYETEAMLKENEILKRDFQLSEAKGKQQLTIIYFLILGFLSTTVFIVILIRTLNQKRKANIELQHKNHLITEQKKEITDSIQYAKRIQNAMLTPGDYIESLLPERFILFRPRDIVSGDFYLLTEKQDKIICAIADCTGHGVPGAFMSMLGIAYLNEIISNNNDISAGQILDELRKYVIRSLRQSDSSAVLDGMDMAILVINHQDNTVEYAGAHNPLYLFRNGELTEYKADKMPIGIHEHKDKPFTTHTIKVKKGDAMYAFSDGFQDQFGGPKGKKFMTRNFKELLANNFDKSMHEQRLTLESALDDWMSDTEQIDDILVMGIKM